MKQKGSSIARLQSLNQSTSKKSIPPNESLNHHDSSATPPIEDSSLANLGNSPVNSESNNSYHFPDNDEIKSFRATSKEFIPTISEALKFHKSPSKMKISSKTSQTLHKSNSKLSGSNSSFKAINEFKDSKGKDNKNSTLAQKPSKNPLMLSMRLYESMDSSSLDENMLIRKLKRSPKNKEDAKFIYSYINKFPFFQKFQEQNLQHSVDEAILHICRYCEYEKHQKNTIIFKEGDPSNEKFYIIISGQVHIYLQDKSVFIQENLEKTQKDNIAMQNQKQMVIRRKSSLFSSPKLTSPLLPRKKGSVMTPTFSHHFQKHAYEQDNVLVKPRYLDPDLMPEIGSKRNELGPGEAFGEKALLISDPDLAKRTATIIAATDVEFMIIKKVEFDRITQRFSKQNEMKFEFLTQTLPFLRSIRSVSTLENLVYSFKEENIGYNMTVVEENEYDPLEKVYFLNEGVCRVEKQFSFLINSISHTAKCNICDLVEGSLIGEEVIFKDFYKTINSTTTTNPEDIVEGAKYQYTVIVQSENAKFYVINKSNFLMKFPKEIKLFLYEKYRLKEKSRKEIYIKNSQELIKRYQEEQLQTLIQANFIKNKDLLKNMNLNMRRNYIEKVKGLADELSKDFYNNFSNKPDTHSTVNSMQKTLYSQYSQQEEKQTPNDIIDTLKIKAKLKDMKKTLKIKPEIIQEITQNPEEIEEFFKNYEYKYLIRKSNVKRAKRNDDGEEDIKAIDQLMMKNTIESCEKLDFGNGVEDEKLERMQRIKLGIFRPEYPKFDHYDIIEHLTSNEKHKKIKKNRTASIDFSSSGVHILKTLGNEGNVSERYRDKRGVSSYDIKKGRTLSKFEKKNKEEIDLDIGKKHEKKEKDFNFYRNLKEKGEIYNRMFKNKRSYL